jgi:hypothetical protein
VSLLSKSRTRPQPKYDDKRHIVATEGVKAEVTYLEGIDSRVMRRFKSKFNVIEIATKDTSTSSPEQRLNDLGDHINNLSLEDTKGARLYLVVDLDRWGQAELSRVAKLCRDKSIDFLVSNPCFEIWIVLHFMSLDEVSEYLDNDSTGSSKQNLLKKKAKELSPGYESSTAIQLNELVKRLENAVKRCMEVDDTNSRWPNNHTSRMYVLMERLRAYLKS